MLDRFTSEITQNRLCEKEHKILLAVSAGVDSMVMLHLFHKAGYTIGVAHANFQLRAAASDEDERFVKSVCDQLKFPFHSKRFSTNNYAEENGISIQMAARELRYTWFRGLMEQEPYDRLATAHHLNDNLETTLLNFVRGTGISGLRGIQPMNDQLIRPLLNFTKKELVSYARSNELLWREDASNDSDDYDRNFLRHMIIPKLQTLNPSLEESFKRTNNRLQGVSAVFQIGMEQLRTKFTSQENAELKISKELLKTIAFPEVLLWELLKNFGFNDSQCLAVVQASGNAGKLFFSSSHQLLVDRESLIVSPLDVNAKEKPNSVVIYKNDKRVKLGELEMLVENSRNEAHSKAVTEASLDAGTIAYPLIWRKWEEGDSFTPLGMKNKKKLSDFFIDAKVARTEKDRATVLVANGEIIWVVGYRISDHYKLTDRTKVIVHLRVIPYL